MSRPQPSQGATIQEGERFETALSRNRKMALVQERANRSAMFGPMQAGDVEELRELVDRLRMGLEPYAGRFRAGDNSSIADTQIYRKIVHISDRDLAELLILLDDLLDRMA
jgi:hypothetical protein